MKFNLKALVAAVALSATAMSANAALDSGNTLGIGSELAFSAYDVTTGIGYTYDLNWNKYLNDIVGVDQAANTAGNATLLANAKVASSLIGAGGVIYDDVLTGLPFGADTSNVQWYLGAYDSQGRTRLLTTKDSTDATAYSSTSNQVKTAVTIFSGYAPSSDAFIVDPAAVANYDLDAYAVTAETNGAAYAGNAGNAFNNNIKDMTNLMGSQSFMYLLAQSTQASSNIAALQTQLTAVNGDKIVAKTYQQGGVWRLNISAVAAVPEPESYAMFLAGLGLMGFIARRRNTAV
jgi:hypothetical protein